MGVTYSTHSNNTHKFFRKKVMKKNTWRLWNKWVAQNKPIFENVV
jgi:hypothetical protein